MAMNKARRTANLNNILTYDTLGNSTLIANLTVEGLTGAGFVKADANGLLSVDTAAYTVVTGATNYLTKITAPNTLGQSLVYDNGTSVYVNSTTGVVGYNHSFTVVANTAGGMVVSTTNTASAIGIVNSASGNKTWDISPFNNTLVINESGVNTSMVFHPGGNITVGDITTTGHKFEVVGSFRTTGNNTLSQLSGVGTRMVVVDTNGLLSTQAIAAGSVTGTGAAGQVAFWTGTSVQSGSNNFFWDNTNGRLGIGTNGPAYTLDVNGNARVTKIFPNGSFGSQASMQVNGPGSGTAQLILTSELNSQYTKEFIMSGKFKISTQYFGNAVYFGNSGTTYTIFTDTNNLAIGSITDTGERLQVTGNVKVNGSFFAGSGTPTSVYLRNATISGITGDIGIGVFNSSTTGTTGITFGESNNIYGGFAKWGSTYGSNYPASSIPLTNSFQIQSGTTNNLPLVIQGTPIILTIGNTGTNYSARLSAGSFRITTLSNAHTDGTALLDLDASTTTAASLRIRSGVAPTTPNEGDIWATTTDLVARVNGTNYSLINSGLTGSGAAGQVTFWNAASGITGSNNLFWDNTNGNLGIGVTVPLQKLHIVDGAIQLTDAYPIRWGTSNLLYGSTTGLDIASSGFAVRFRFTTGGNFLINSTADSGERLQVSGNVKITGTNTSSFTSALSVLNSSGGTPTLTVLNDNSIKVGLVSMYPTVDKGNSVNVAAGGFFIGYTSGAGYTAAPSVTLGKPLNFANTHTAGNMTMVSMVGQFAPTSGAGTFTTTVIEPTINQTGGANGITRGLYVAPTLTAAADWRSVEWSNNTGWGLYGAGTANNYIAGNLLLGSTTSVLGYKLEVTGNSFFSNYVQIGNGVNIPNGSNALRVVGYGSFNFDFNNSTGFTFPGVELLRNYLRLGVGGGTAYIGNNSFQAGSDLFIHAGWYSVLQAYGKVTIGTAFNSSASRAMAVFDMQTETVSLGNNTINANSKVTVAGSITSASAVARGGYFNNTLVAAANNDVLVALDVAPTFTNGAFTGVQNYAIRANGQISAGNAQATAGSVVLRTTYSSGNISTIGTNGSSGGVTISYGAYPASTSTSDAFLSGIGFTSFPRSAYAVESDHRWLSAASATVAEGSAVTLTEKMRLYNSGNLVIQNGGTYTDSGDRLQVTGTIKATSTSTATNFLANGTDAVSAFRFQDGQTGIYDMGSSVQFRNWKVAPYQFTYQYGERTSGIRNIIEIPVTVNPTSGTATYSMLVASPTINQTGGANGITRGLYVNPTITAAADWRSIEWSNNSGYGLYGAGTAQNLLNGKLTVNHTVLSANFTNANTMGVFGQQLLNIPAGSQGTSGAVYAASSGFHYFRFNGNTTLVGDALWAASIAVSNIQFDTTGTVTMADGVGGGTRQRALSGMQIQMQTAGNNNGTVTKAAGLLIQGCYPSTGTGVTTFDQFAGIRINDLTEWGTARITMTDRWGIYQAGVDDKNHFNGAVLIGTTTVGGSKLKVSGLPTSATGLTAGDIWNNGGVLNIV